MFPTVTRVNAASITTGCYPGRHGLAGNEFLDRRFDPARVLPALRDELLEMYRATGRLLLAPNLAATLGAHGEQYVSVVTGSSGNGFIHNPHAAEVGGAAIHPEFCEPAGLHDYVIGRFGRWPGSVPPARRGRRASPAAWTCSPRACWRRWTRPSPSSGAWSPTPATMSTASARTRPTAGWPPPTASSDASSSGSTAPGGLARTDVLVGSDHGYATVTEAVHVAGLVEAAGFPPADEPGGVMVASNGGSVLFYVARSDRETADRLAAWLMAQPWCGPIVASEASGSPEGTLPASLVGVEGERAPDLAMSFAWDSEPNAGGYPGRIFSTSKMPGQGNHGSMSRHEQRCTFIARGPAFKSGVRVDTPSGNVDVMPTVLRLLGIDPLAPVDGACWRRAWTEGRPPRPTRRRPTAPSAASTASRSPYPRSARHPT